MDAMGSVGIVGLGRMGTVMARTLKETTRVFGWDIRDFEDPPAEIVASPAKLAESCQLVLLSLPSPAVTRQVLLDAAFRSSWERSDCVVADTSTSDPASHSKLLADLGSLGTRLLDAPILGRPDTCGRWTIPVGGDETSIEKARGHLEKLGSRVIHVGDSGTAFTIKLLNNMMFAAINVITAEAIGASGYLGISAKQFVDVVAGSSAATVSPLFRDLAPRMTGELEQTVFTTRLLDKDLRLAVQMCEEAGVPLISSRALQIATSRALHAGLGDRDSAALVQIYEEGEH